MLPDSVRGLVTQIKRTLLRSPIGDGYRELHGRINAHRFLALLDRHLKAGRPVYSEEFVRSRLVARSAERRRLDGEPPTVAAFGGSGWLQYGFWPAFAKLTRFHLSAYGEEHAPPVAGESGAEMRQRRERGFLKFVDEIGAVDVAFFYASGEHLSSALFAELHRRGIWTVVMGLDDQHQFLGPRDADDVPHQQRIACLCDVYWTTWKLGAQIVLNWGGTPWLAPEGADPEFHRCEPRERDIDVLFVGLRSRHRASLVEFLGRRGFRVSTFGEGWPAGSVDFETAVGLFNRAKIVLGVGETGGMPGVRCLKGRDFEVSMCGAAYLTSYQPELADCFRIGEEIACYSSLEECAQLIHYYLEHPDKAEKLRQAARARCLADHTWQRRVGALLGLMGGAGRR
jgi:hypothetical protein